MIKHLMRFSKNLTSSNLSFPKYLKFKLLIENGLHISNNVKSRSLIYYEEKIILEMKQKFASPWP